MSHRIARKRFLLDSMFWGSTIFVLLSLTQTGAWARPGHPHGPPPSGSPSGKPPSGTPSGSPPSGSPSGYPSSSISPSSTASP